MSIYFTVTAALKLLPAGCICCLRTRCGRLFYTHVFAWAMRKIYPLIAGLSDRTITVFDSGTHYLGLLKIFQLLTGCRVPASQIPVA